MSGNADHFQQAMKKGHSAAWDQDWARAAGFYRQALVESPTDSKALNSLGLALYELQDFKESLRVYLKAAEVSLNDPMPLEKAAEIQEQMGNKSQSINLYLKAAELYAKNREVEKAIESWSRVVKLDPENMLAHSRLGVVYERMGRSQQATIEYLALAGLFQNSGDPLRAGQTLTHAAQVYPASPEIYQAIEILKAGQKLPHPTRARDLATPAKPTGQTRPLSGTKPRLGMPPEEQIDPIAEARKKALADLARLLFEQGEGEREPPGLRKGMQAIITGIGGPEDRKHIDQTKMMLHLSQAVDMQSRGQGTQAIEELNRAMDSGLEHPAASFLMGILMADTGREETALLHLKQSLGIADYAMGAHLLMGQILQKLERFSEAATECLEALRLADAQLVPKNMFEELQLLYDPLIEAQANQPMGSQKRLCANVFEMLIRPNWREHLMKARQQLPAQADDGGLVPLAEILVEARGSRVVESIARIRQYAKEGYLRSAMEEAYYALQFAPTYLPLHTYIGEILLQENRVQTAVDKFIVVAESYSMRGESKRAVDLYRRIIDTSPMNMDARNLLVKQLTTMGRSEDAINEYMNLADVYYNLADLTAARKTYNQALKLAQQVNLDKSWKVKVLYRMADIDLQSLDWRQALRQFESIRNLEPEDEQARINLIDLNLRLGQTAQAIAEVDNFVMYLWNGGKKDQAIQLLENLATDYPKQAGIHRRLGELYRKVGRIPEAIEHLDTAGELMVETGDKAGAIEAISTILSLNPSNASGYHKLLDQLKSEK